MHFVTLMCMSVSNIAGLPPVRRVAAFHIAFADVSWRPRPLVRFLMRHVDCVLEFTTVQIPVDRIFIDDQHHVDSLPNSNNRVLLLPILLLLLFAAAAV
jgi:hypothetical protein